MDYTNASGIDPYAKVSSQNGPLQAFTPDMQIAEWQNRDTARALYQQAIQQGNIANQQAGVNLGKSQYDLAKQAQDYAVYSAGQAGRMGAVAGNNQAMITKSQADAQQAMQDYLDKGRLWLGQQLSAAKLPVSDAELAAMKPADQQAFMSSQASKYMDVINNARARGINVGDVPTNPADFMNYVQGTQGFYQTMPEMRKANLMADTERYKADRAAISREEVQGMKNEGLLREKELMSQLAIAKGQQLPTTYEEMIIRDPNMSSADKMKAIVEYRKQLPQFNSAIQGGIAGAKDIAAQEAETAGMLLKLQQIGASLSPAQKTWLNNYFTRQNGGSTSSTPAPAPTAPKKDAHGRIVLD